MIFLYYQPLFYASNVDQFQFCDGELHPTRGVFTESTPTQPVWHFHIGV